MANAPVPPQGSASSGPTFLAIDLVLQALIGRPGCPVEGLIEEAAKGQMKPVVLDLALYAAMSSIQPGDKVNHKRFAELLRYAKLAPSGSRPEGGAFAPPSREEIAHWRNVALGKND